MASLDAARQFVATQGQEAMDKTHEISAYAREQISKINGFVPCGKDHFLTRGCYDYDDTKLVIKLEHLDINGFDVYQLLQKDYKIQIELAETYAIMAILAIGTGKKQIDKLIAALKDISKKHYKKTNEYKRHAFGIEFPVPKLEN